MTPFSPITFGKSRRAAQVNDFIPSQASGKPTRGQPTQQVEVSSEHALWAQKSGSVSNIRVISLQWEADFFWLCVPMNGAPSLIPVSSSS